MLRRLIKGPGSIATIASVIILSSFMTSCGGSGTAAKDMVLLEFLLVDRAQVPVAPTGTENLPRNAQILMVFSELVNPFSVSNQTIQIRFGSNFQSVPEGSFSVTGNTVRFDPTVTSQGQPNPFGFEPVTQYIVDIPNFEEQQDVLQNLDFDPNLSTFFSIFTTSAGFLRELIPPQIVGVGFIPDPDALTGNIPANGLFYLDFNEAMDPATFIAGPSASTVIANGGAIPTTTTVDIRYTNAPINAGGGLVVVDPGPPMLEIGEPVAGTFSFDASATRYFFRPTFSFGNQKFIFTAQVFQGLKDLSGNLLVNPGSFGPFTCDGTGIDNGKVISEDFLTTGAQDPTTSDADWGATEEGILKGVDITSRDVYIFSYNYADDFGTNADSGRGQYAAIVDPLTGADLNNLVSGVSPATSLGRRAMWSYGDLEIGASGSVTAAQWGPDSNATFAAQYDNVILRMGFQKNDSISLGTSFSGNYEGSPAVVYNGDYSVTQNANVGNTPGHPITNHVGGYPTNPGCNPTNGVGVIFPWNAPLFDASGFFPWPELTTFFEWDQGSPGVENDSVFLFDASVTEGDSFQQIRSWFGSTFPCSGVLLGGIPNRRLYATYEEASANPETNFGAGILNPEPTVMDMCFTITKRVSIGQSFFYTDPGNPNQTPGGSTFGALTDYRPAEVLPAIQAGGAQVVLEFQGATLVEADRRTINQAAPFTGWTQDIDDLDGLANIRWRCSLISNLISLEVARVAQIRIPMTQD